MAQVLSFQGLLALGHGDVTTARACLEESLALARSSRNLLSEAFVLNHLGDATAMSGDLEAAPAHYERSLLAFKTLNDPWGMGLAINSLAGVAWFSGDHEKACALYTQSVALARQAGDRWIVVRPLLGLLDASWHQGDYAQAKSLAIESLTLCRELGAKSGLLLSLSGAAGLFTACGHPAIAAQLLGAGDALSDRIGFVSYAIDRMRHDRNLELTRSKLDETALQAAWVIGQAMTPDLAVDYALEEMDRL